MNLDLNREAYEWYEFEVVCECDKCRNVWAGSLGVVDSEEKAKSICLVKRKEGHDPRIWKVSHKEVLQ